jgi:hypothetical protein
MANLLKSSDAPQLQFLLPVARFQDFCMTYSTGFKSKFIYFLASGGWRLATGKNIPNK